jgi:phage host-nuclease inhibitor protein Gam
MSKARRVNVATLHRCMEEIGDLVKEFRQLKSEMEEKKKHKERLLEEFVLELRLNKNKDAGNYCRK